MIELNREELLAELLFLAQATKRKTHIPILDAVLVEPGDSITLTHTDLDRIAKSLLTPIQYGTEPFGVSLKDLTNAVKNSNTETVTLSPNKGRVAIVCGRVKFSIPKHEADQFPNDPEFKSDIEFEIAGKTFADVLKLTAFAGDANAAQSSQQSVFIKNNGTLSGFAWNGAISSIITSKKPILETEFEFAIPLDSVPLAIRICEAKQVKVQVDTNHVSIIADRRTALIRRHSAKAPNYEPYRQPNEEHNLIAPAQVLAESIRSSQSLDELIVNSDGRFASLLFTYQSEKEVGIKSIRGDSEFESVFEADVKEFPEFKLNTFQFQKLFSVIDRKSEIRARLSKDTTVLFADTEDFQVEFIQANLNF